MASLNTPVTGEVKETIKNLFNTKKYSDLGIYCRGKFWDVHQAIVCMRSTVLETFCTKSGRQSQGKLHIDLSDYESEVLEAVLSFMYLDHYTTGDEEGLVFHTKVFIAACKFEMPGLRDLALGKYQNVIKNMGLGWENRFCLAAGILWRELSGAMGGSVLKDVVVEVARERVGELMCSKGGEFKALGLEKPEIGMAVLEAVVRSKMTTPFVEKVEEVIDVAGVVESTPVAKDDTLEASNDSAIPVIEDEDSWGSFSTAKSKKAKKKMSCKSPWTIDTIAIEEPCQPAMYSDVEESVQELEPAIYSDVEVLVQESEPATYSDVEVLVQESEPATCSDVEVLVQEPESSIMDDFPLSITKKSKKDKKGKKKIAVKQLLDELAVEAEPSSLWY